MVRWEAVVMYGALIPIVLMGLYIVYDLWTGEPDEDKVRD